jgi:hypothetical protein
LLDRKQLLSTAAVRQAQSLVQEDLQRETKVSGAYSFQSLQNQLSLLLIDPLAVMPPLSAGFHPQDPQVLSLAIQIAFLQGGHASHDQWIDQAKKSENNLSLAKILYDLGDYPGSVRLVDGYLAQHQDTDGGDVTEAQALKREVLADQQALRESLNVLGMLPRRIPEGYWRKTASEILELGTANGQAHGLLGVALEKRRQPELAMMQLKLAAKYADAPEEKQLWTRRLDKLHHNLLRFKLPEFKMPFTDNDPVKPTK